MNNKGRNWPKAYQYAKLWLTTTKGDWRNENRAETYSRRAQILNYIFACRNLQNSQSMHA